MYKKLRIPLAITVFFIDSFGIIYALSYMINVLLTEIIGITQFTTSHPLWFSILLIIISLYGIIIGTHSFLSSNLYYVFPNSETSKFLRYNADLNTLKSFNHIQQINGPIGISEENKTKSKKYLAYKEYVQDVISKNKEYNPSSLDCFVIQKLYKIVMKDVYIASTALIGLVLYYIVFCVIFNEPTKIIKMLLLTTFIIFILCLLFDKDAVIYKNGYYLYAKYYSAKVEEERNQYKEEFKKEFERIGYEDIDDTIEEKPFNEYDKKKDDYIK